MFNWRYDCVKYRKGIFVVACEITHSLTLTHTLHYITLEKIRLRQLIILILVVYKNVVEHTLWYMMMSLFNYINTLTSLSHSHVLLSWMWYLLLGEKLLLICNIFSVSWTDRPLCWLTYLYYPNWSAPGWSESNFFSWVILWYWNFYQIFSVKLDFLGSLVEGGLSYWVGRPGCRQHAIQNCLNFL